MAKWVASPDFVQPSIHTLYLPAYLPVSARNLPVSRISWYLPVSPGISRGYPATSRHIPPYPPYPAISRRGYREKNRPHTRDCQWPEGAHTSMIKFKRPTRAPDPALTSRSPLRRYLSLPRATPLAARLPRGPWCLELGLSMWVGGTLQCRVPFVLVKVWYLPLSFDSPGEWYGM